MRIAGLTSFNPELSRFKSNLDSIAEQFDYIYVWDNGSTNFEEIKNICRNYDGKVHLETEGTNIGVASALNHIVQRSSDLGSDWVLLLDQDSIPPKNLYTKLMQYTKQDIAIVSPKIRDINRSKEDQEAPEVEDFMWPITSGSLLNVAIWEKIGGFDDKLFIDFVDDEYSIRVILNGYRSIRVNSIELNHEIGHLVAVGVPFPHFENKKIIWRRAYSSGHSPMRHYYQVRNLAYIRTKYKQILAKHGVFLPSLTKFILHSIIFEPHKISNCKAMYSGLQASKRLIISNPLESNYDAKL